ncbi:hypothetical protein PCANB_002140 [Pneumocystis canis]|nr:hypothetical protein PCK1_001819 [Pneumocystis canis]KAG5439564.1 hypothetical protein PCANB_002140 [Pneumocystis canis]
MYNFPGRQLFQMNLMNLPTFFIFNHNFIQLLRFRSYTSKLLYSTKYQAQEFHEKLSSGPSLNDFIEHNIKSFNSIPTSNSTSTYENTPQRLPTWLHTRIISNNDNYRRIRRDLRGLGLYTVCEEARCPNITECWGGNNKSSATATIMLMGNTCTRGCRFCAVKTSETPPPLDPNEPKHTAEAISRWGLGYIVLTSVDRDDLPDNGAAHFAETIREVKKRSPNILLEALTGDFAGHLKDVETVVMSGLDVFAHNLETVETLTPYVRDRRATFRQSLSVLKHAKICQPKLITKTSFMLGLGEQEDEVKAALIELRKIHVDIVTFGQYMRPTKKHMKVHEYIHPNVFEKYKQIAEKMGFLYVASGPLIRSSYKAGEAFIENILKKRHNKHDLKIQS